MKQVYSLLFFLIATLPLTAQQFLWANSYEIPDCNEVAAAAADTNGNVFLTGVYEAPVFLPYTGDAYILKTDPEGEIIWNEVISGTLQIADIIAINESAVIIGQSNGPFVYKGDSYGPANYFLFMFRIDGDGNHEWHLIDEDLYGANARLAAGKLETIAVSARGQSNLGDWIIILDSEGGVLNSRLLAPNSSLIVDMAFYDDRIYLNGGFSGPGSIIIDTLVIQQPNVENATFVLALNEDLEGEWVVVDTAFNNHDGRVVANSNGVFAYSAVLEPPFNLVTVLKKFTLDGILQKEVEVPVFSNAVALYPDMTIGPDRIALYMDHDFDFDNHKVILYDFNLDIKSQKLVIGPSDLYSGQVVSFEEDFFIAHVYSGELNFNDELVLPYEGSGKLPYLARIGEPSTTHISVNQMNEYVFHIYPNPADEFLNISYNGIFKGPVQLDIFDMKGMEMISVKLLDSQSTININSLSKGVYIATLTMPDGRIEQQKVLVQ